MNVVCFSNKYGKATLTPVSEILPVSMVSFAKMPELIKQVNLTIEQAEQLALITENNNVQISFNLHKKVIYALYHVTPNTVLLCSASIDYVGVDGVSPAALIESLRIQSIAA